MKTEEELIWESYSDKASVDYGSLMVYFDGRVKDKLKKYCDEHVPIDALHDLGGCEEPHITCQCGFHSDVTPDDITSFVNQIKTSRIRVTLGEISRVDADNYDILMVDVDSPDLQALSDNIREFFDGRIDIKYSEYQPHVTLAYIKKGSLPHIDDESMFNGKNYVFDGFVYSDACFEQYDILKGDK